MSAITYKPNVLVVEDETLNEYLRNLQSDAYDLMGASTLDEALDALKRYDFDVVVVDLKLPDSVEQGAQIIQTIRQLDKSVAVIVITAEHHAAKYVIQDLGAWDFLPKPFDFADCRLKIRRAIEGHRYRLTAIETASQGGFAPIHNPYIVGSPLGAGNVMFYGQEEIFDFIRNNIGAYPNHNHLALIGPRRIGKTSILQQLSRQLPATEFVPVNINCQAFGIDLGMPAFFLKLISQITRSLRQQKLDTATLPIVTTAELQSDYASPALQFTERFLPNVYRVLQSRSLILCLDEFEELADKVHRQRLDVSVFDFLHEMMVQEKQMILMLAGTRRLVTLSEVCPAATSIVAATLHRQVLPLSPVLTRRLIKEPVAYSGMSYQEPALAAIQKATGGYPYLVQLLCNSLVNLRNDHRKNEITVTDVQEAMTALVETAQPGFFWESLTLYQKIALLAVAKLASQHTGITASRVEGELQYMGVNLLSWPPTIQIAAILRELSFEGLLCEQSHPKKGLTYTLAFELSEKWIHRHKNLEQVLKEKYLNA